MTLPARFEEKYVPEPNTGCWLWVANLQGAGYGRFSFGGRNVMAHRFSYSTERGPIPAGLVLDHKCRVRCCVNPWHLRAVTMRQNAVENSLALSAINAAKTRCMHGHPFTQENTRVEVRPGRSRPRRACRQCIAVRAMEKRRKP